MELASITISEFFLWAFGGVGGSYFFYILALKKNKSPAPMIVKEADNSFSDASSAENSQINKVGNGASNSQATVSVNIVTADSRSHSGPASSSEGEVGNLSLDSKKGTTRILFIDDEIKFKLVKILQKSGWLHTKLIKDVESLDQIDVYQADIIFVDIQGVGIELGFSEQGLGLASALKKKYPEKKVIIYSAEQTGDRFHKALREVDDWLPKDADPYQFQMMVEQYS